MILDSLYSFVSSRWMVFPFWGILLLGMILGFVNWNRYGGATRLMALACFLLLVQSITMNLFYQFFFGSEFIRSFGEFMHTMIRLISGLFFDLGIGLLIWSVFIGRRTRNPGYVPQNRSYNPTPPTYNPQPDSNVPGSTDIRER